MVMNRGTSVPVSTCQIEQNRTILPPGVLIGPFTPGYVADQSIAKDLAEIGVILLMFGVGLHFTLDDLLSVKAIAVPGALVQIASATVLGMGLAWLLGWTVGAGLVFGLERPRRQRWSSAT